MLLPVVAALASVVGLARPFVPTTPITWAGAYKDAAHALVGLLVGLGLATRRREFWAILALLTAEEVICFLLPR